MDELRPNLPPKPPLKFDDFAKLDLRVARVLECREHPNADKLLVLKVDLGVEHRQICVGLKHHYNPHDLLGKLVVVVTNMEPRSMRGEPSQGLLLTAKEPQPGGGVMERIVIISPSAEVAVGSTVS